MSTLIHESWRQRFDAGSAEIIGVDVDPDLMALIDSVTAKRPRQVLDHILKHGYVTTAELASEYGYNHPPRAARDVREHGIPLETYRVDGPDGRKIGAYRLGDAAAMRSGRAGGRRSFPKAFKDLLVETYGTKCALCGWDFEPRALQIDHRVPYEVAGDESPLSTPEAFMLVCGSCNRSKSWSCEHCSNLENEKSSSVCRTCLWASPESYEHIATEQRRSVTLAWQGQAIEDYRRLEAAARKAGVPMAEYARELLARALSTPKQK